MNDSFKFHRVSSGKDAISTCESLMVSETERAYQKTMQEMGWATPQQTQRPQSSAKEQAFDAIIAKLGLTDDQIQDMLVGTSAQAEISTPVGTVPEIDPLENNIPDDILKMQATITPKRDRSVKKTPVSSYLDAAQEARAIIDKRRLKQEAALPKSENTEQIIVEEISTVDTPIEAVSFSLSKS